MEQTTIGVRTLLATVSARSWLIATITLIAVAATFFLSISMPAKYKATATLIIAFDQPVESMSDSRLAPALQPNYMSTQLGIIQSRHVAGKVVDRLGLVGDAGWQEAFAQSTGGVGSLREWIAGVLLSGLEVWPGDNSRLVKINYTAGDPMVAAERANAFAAAYEATNLEMSTQPAQREVERYQDWLEELRGSVARAQQSLSAYQQEKGIILVDERLDVESARLEELVNQRIRSEAEARSAEIRHRRIAELEANRESLETVPEVMSNAVFRELKAQVSRKEAELAEGAEQLGRNHPRYKQLSAELAVLQKQVDQEVTAIVAGLANEVQQARSRADAFKEAEDSHKARMLEIKQSREEMPALVRELRGAQANYDQALALHNQFRVQSQASQTNVTLLNPALPPMMQASPDTKRNIALAAVLGLMLGIGIAVLMELIDRRVRTEDDLEQWQDLTYLGALPGHR